MRSLVTNIPTATGPTAPPTTIAETGREAILTREKGIHLVIEFLWDLLNVKLSNSVAVSVPMSEKEVKELKEQIPAAMLEGDQYQQGLLEKREYLKLIIDV